MGSHTPSPWIVRDFTVGVERRLTRLEIHGPTTSGRGFHPVCAIPSGFTHQRGDANLIAAAPELEIALAAWILHSVDMGFYVPQEIKVWAKATWEVHGKEHTKIDVTKAAIAKIEGTSTHDELEAL